MTPSDIVTAARDLYNASGDTYFSDTQMYNWLWHASNQLAREARLVEAITTTSTVASTQGYVFPTNAFAIKRVTVNGRKIKRITMRMDDAITLSNQTITSTGWPIYYFEWNQTIYLRPIPDTAYTLTIYSNNLCAVPTAASTLEIPTIFHMDLVDFILMNMFAKDKDPAMMQMYMAKWDKHVLDAVRFNRKEKIADSFNTVQDEGTLPVTILGEA